MTAISIPEPVISDDERAAKRGAIARGLAAAKAGRVVSDEKVSAWLDSWGTDEELPKPTCD